MLGFWGSSYVLQYPFHLVSVKNYIRSIEKCTVLLVCMCILYKTTTIKVASISITLKSFFLLIYIF